MGMLEVTVLATMERTVVTGLEIIDGCRILVIIGGERQKPLQKAARWPCGVCGRGVSSDSIKCTSCHKWVQREACTK